MGTYKNQDFWLNWVIGDGATRAIHQCGRGRPGSLVFVVFPKDGTEIQAFVAHCNEQVVGIAIIRREEVVTDQ